MKFTPARVLLTALCFVPLYVFSQDKTPALEEVIVLGSLIPRADYASISPVFTLDRESLEMESRKTVAEVLNRYPQFHGGPNASFSHTGRGSGAAPVNLRNLGGERTLVLLNGRRLGPSGANGIVDSNTLPVGLVERVEVLTGGASSVYGSDAMAGVVNFTLRDRMEGLELEASAGRTDRGDGDTANLSLLGGLEFSGGRGQLTGYLNYFDRESIARAERDISSQPLLEDYVNGTLVAQGSPSLPGGYATWPAVIEGASTQHGLTFDEAGNPRAFTQEDYFNTSALHDLQQEEQRINAGAFASFQLSETTRLYLGLILANNDSNITLAPTPLNYNNLVINLDNPVLTEQTRETLANSYDPRGTGTVFPPFNYRVMPLGNRERDFERDNTWINLELDGSWFGGWHWNLAYTFSDFNMRLEETGGADPQKLQQAVLVSPESSECFDPSGGCSPADIFGPGRLSAEATAFIATQSFMSREDTRQQVVSLRTNGIMALIDNLDTGIALGLEWRKDEVEYRPDPDLLPPIVFGFAHNTPTSGDNSVAEAYGELLQPLMEGTAWVQSLELELGLRYSDYSNIGGEWTWKTGLNWALNSGLRFRGSYQRAARAPNLVENYLSTVSAQFPWLGNFVPDPCAASHRPQDFPGRVDLCVSQGIDPANLASYEPAPVVLRTIAIGGNENLEVEKADTYTLGLVWTPTSIEGLSLSLDYYQIDIEDLIHPVNAWDAFPLCYELGPAGGFCEGIERVPEGDVSRWQGAYYNLGGLKTNGYDLGLSYHWLHAVPWDWPSSLSISTVLNRLESWELDLGQGATLECAGRFGSPCVGVNPKHRALSRLQYQTGSLAAALTWRWLDSVDNARELSPRPPGVPFATAVPRAESQDYLDLNLAWHVGDSVALRFDVINLTDNAPPLLGGNETVGGTNTDPGAYDVLGRRYQLGLRLRF